MSETKKAVAKTNTTLPENPMQMLAHAVTTGTMPVEALEKLMALAEHWEDRQAKKAFENAYAGFTGEVPSIFKTKLADRGKGGKYKYADIADLMNTVRPHLQKWGLAVRFGDTEMIEGQIKVICIVSHRDGHSTQSTFTAPIDKNMHANDTQKIGSANSYVKRYALGNVLNLTPEGEDNDMNVSQAKPGKDEIEACKADIAKAKTREELSKVYQAYPDLANVKEIRELFSKRAQEIADADKPSNPEPAPNPVTPKEAEPAPEPAPTPKKRGRPRKDSVPEKEGITVTVKPEETKPEPEPAPKEDTKPEPTPAPKEDKSEPEQKPEPQDNGTGNPELDACIEKIRAAKSREELADIFNSHTQLHNEPQRSVILKEFQAKATEIAKG